MDECVCAWGSESLRERVSSAGVRACGRAGVRASICVW